MKTTKIMITSASFAIAMSALAHAGVNSQGKVLTGEPIATSILHGVEDASTVSRTRPSVNADYEDDDLKRRADRR